MDDIPTLASYVLERPAFGAFTLSLVGLIAVGWYAVQRHDESKPIKTPTRILLVGFALSTVVLAGVAFWPLRIPVVDRTTELEPIPAVAQPLIASDTTPDAPTTSDILGSVAAKAKATPQRPPEPQPVRESRVGPNSWGIKCFNRPFEAVNDEHTALLRQCTRDGDPQIIGDGFYDTETDALAALRLLNPCIARSSQTFRCEAEYSL
jgi:hypothetical protein